MLVYERAKEMVEMETATGCPCGCTQRFKDLLRAAQPVKKSSLEKVACVDCGKVFWADSKKEYCFNCEAKKHACKVHVANCQRL